MNSPLAAEPIRANSPVVAQHDDVNPRFNDKADQYARFAIVQRELVAWLAEWLEPIADQESIAGQQPAPHPAHAALELGAGDGLFTRHLAERYSRLSAIDVAPRMVERGRQLLPNVGWCVDDAWSLVSEPVDRLYSASLLQWCQEPVRVLEHWRTLVKRQGRALHGFYVAPTLAEWRSVAAERSPVEWRSPAEWESMFAAAGWSVARSEAETRALRFASARELLAFFHHTGAVKPRRTPVGALRRMLTEYDRRFASANSSAGVTATWTFYRIELINP